jgi:asparagine synthase (glutamine-hydrolysing)
MCGFGGFLDLAGRFDQRVLERIAAAMAEAIRHRGPDDRGVYCEPALGLALGFRRLSVIDLSPSGHQPMVSVSGRSVIVFNGEIYNHADIRAELVALGHVFRGRSDTEVLLEACEAWGVQAAIERCIGMFAFAVFDRIDRKLWLARDRLGVKPLYVGRCGRTVLFASQPKVFHAHPDFVPQIDPKALSAYIRFGYVPSPHSIYFGISQVRPGTILSVACDGTPTEQTYWDVRQVAASGLADPVVCSDPELLDRLDSLLRDAVRQRMIADVPVGAFLSGGIDSSLVVALMQAQSGRSVKTFTIGFSESSYDEAPHAKAVARHLGTEHHEFYLSAPDALVCIPELPEWYDEPFADYSQIPMLFLSRLARRHVTVSLSGDGGDELFAGYHRYGQIVKKIAAASEAADAGRLADEVPATGFLRDLWAVPPTIVRDLAKRWFRRRSGSQAASALEMIYRRLVQPGLEPNTILRHPDEPIAALWTGALATIAQEVVPRCQLIDILTYLPDDILTKVDRATMAVGLEARGPFLDHRLVELVWRLPATAKMHEGESKWALRRLLERHVSRSIIDRPKMGFGAPIEIWLRGPLRAWAEDLLNERALIEDGIFDASAVRRLWTLHLGGEDRHSQLWCLLMFQAWKRRWITPSP